MFGHFIPAALLLSCHSYLHTSKPAHTHTHTLSLSQSHCCFCAVLLVGHLRIYKTACKRFCRRAKTLKVGSLLALPHDDNANERTHTRTHAYTTHSLPPTSSIRFLWQQQETLQRSVRQQTASSPASTVSMSCDTKQPCLFFFFFFLFLTAITCRRPDCALTVSFLSFIHTCTRKRTALNRARLPRGYAVLRSPLLSMCQFYFLVPPGTCCVTLCRCCAKRKTSGERSQTPSRKSTQEVSGRLTSKRTKLTRKQS